MTGFGDDVHPWKGLSAEVAGSSHQQNSSGKSRRGLFFFPLLPESEADFPEFSRRCLLLSGLNGCGSCGFAEKILRWPIFPGCRKGGSGVADGPMLRFEVFGQQAVNLQQSFAGESECVSIELQIAGMLLVCEWHCEFGQRID